VAAGDKDGLAWERRWAGIWNRWAWNTPGVLAAAYQRNVPVTVHVAVGTDTTHVHPALDAAALGRATHRDFRLFCALARGLDQGGVYLNTGSAVLLPEVFLKAVSAVRNLGYSLRDFTTVNFDFLQPYRARVNVVERPHAGAGGRGLNLVGHHELNAALGGGGAVRDAPMNEEPIAESGFTAAAPPPADSFRSGAIRIWPC